MKTCTCCGQTYDSATWRLLPFVGQLDVPAGDSEDEPAETLEMRNCTCGSTIATRELVASESGAS